MHTRQPTQQDTGNHAVEIGVGIAKTDGVEAFEIARYMGTFGEKFLVAVDERHRNDAQSAS